MYMGIHSEPQIEDYWNTKINSGPLYTIPFHISIRRFQQIKRYLHISNSEEDIQQQRSSTDEWWYKLEPLASDLQRSFRRFYTPGSKVSVGTLLIHVARHGNQVS